MEFLGIAIGVSGLLFSSYGLWIVNQSRKRFTPGIVRSITNVLTYTFANLVVYSAWTLIQVVGVVSIADGYVREIPTITLMFLFLILALKTRDLAKEYGFER